MNCFCLKPSAFVLKQLSDFQLQELTFNCLLFFAGRLFYNPETFPFILVTSEGSIRMEEGEELWLIENDQGDGWTRVRRVDANPTDPMPEGFVPSSYM